MFERLFANFPIKSLEGPVHTVSRQILLGGPTYISPAKRHEPKEVKVCFSADHTHLFYSETPDKSFYGPDTGDLILPDEKVLYKISPDGSAIEFIVATAFGLSYFYGGLDENGELCIGLRPEWMEPYIKGGQTAIMCADSDVPEGVAAILPNFLYNGIYVRVLENKTVFLRSPDGWIMSRHAGGLNYLGEKVMEEFRMVKELILND